LSEAPRQANDDIPLVDFEDVFESAPCGYILADRDGRITRANKTLADWIATSSAQMAGKRFSDLLPVTGKIFYETHFAPMLHMQGRFSEVALELVRADGSRAPILVNAIAVRDQSVVSQIRFTVFFAAERRQYERGLLDARDRAEAAIVNERADSELREQFIAVLGHDLRNPLASITSGIHMLERESLSPRGKKVATLMASSVLRAGALIDNVLDFARGRLGGGISLDRNADEPLEPVLRQVVSELRSVNPEHIITQQYDLDQPISCDRMRVGQLLSNLLGNALTHGAKDEPVKIEASTAEGEFVLAVSNGGEPIPEAAMERLFQPFFRGHDRVNHGLGLGLHIASEIARAHDGALIVHSDQAATTFVFTMPLDV
jgi:sigma-B regulation protein RsbU (phosphoserine phosphatase)